MRNEDFETLKESYPNEAEEICALSSVLDYFYFDKHDDATCSYLDYAIKVLKDKEKYRWHDLRKTPEDLPPVNPTNTHENDVLLIVEDDAGKREIYKGHLNDAKPKDEWDKSGKQNFFGLTTYESNWTIWGWSYYRSFKVLAWRYLESIEEVLE